MSSLLRLPSSVVADVKGYRAVVERFLRGEVTPAAFKAYRVPMGVYEQRKDDTYMVRVRLGAGLLTVEQLRALARLSQGFGNGQLHVTTRQDIQIHDVSLANTCCVHEQLLEVGLAGRGGGGNTVRNISASPRAGVERRESFDVRPYAIAAAEYLLQSPSSYTLPRKYKISFSGTDRDDAFASVTDLGFFAQTKDGAPGFRVFAGGGQGGSPRPGVLIEDWVPAEKVLDVAEAIKRLFDAHGDRSNRNAARLRYVVKRLGEEAFVRLYKELRTAVEVSGLEGEVPTPRPLPSPYDGRHGSALPAVFSEATVLPERANGFYSIRLNLSLGDLSAEDAIGLAQIAETYADPILRTSQQQDLFLTAVAGKDVPVVLEQLQDLSADLLGISRASVVACAGASTCKLGFCLSRGLAGAIDRELKGQAVSPEFPVIRISGCPNSCGNHRMAALGFEGKVRRIHDRLMPHYEVLAGGRVGPGSAELAQRLGAIPAKAVPAFVKEAMQFRTATADELKPLVAKHAVLPDVVPEEYFVDWDAREPFSIAGRGPGEEQVAKNTSPGGDS